MTAIIGDIHGCYYTLRQLYDKVKEKYPHVDIYCVGDLVDRGNFNYEVIEFIQQNKIIFTPGNHDYMFYYYIHHPGSELGFSWIYNGYEKTLNSYKSRIYAVEGHLSLIYNSPLFINLDDCFISHAGVSKYYQKRIDNNCKENLQLLSDLIYEEFASEHGVLWTRDELLNIGKLQIVGHTRKTEVLYKKKSNALYIDTSAFTGNKLSCVIIEKNELSDIIDVTTDKRDIQ